MGEKIIKQVRDTLLKPIVCIKPIKKPFIHNDIIYTGQTYYSTPDEDMSDFAVGFYNIVYGEILKNGMLNDGHLLNKNFAGDTMNSFINIAKLADFEKNPFETKKALLDYYYSYHCLANFWVLPFNIGRRSAKLNLYDSFDEFLKKINNESDYKKTLGKYELYIDAIPYNDFLKKHFLNDYTPTNIAYKEDTVIDLIVNAKTMMELRASAIANSDKAAAIHKYFSELNLIKENETRHKEQGYDRFARIVD